MKEHTLPRLGWLIAAAGALLLGWGGWNLIQPDKGDLHRYTRGDPPAAEELSASGLPADNALEVSRYTVSADGVDRPVATALVTESGTLGPVLLAWENNLAEPLLYQQGPLPELTKVAQAIREHAAADSVILGWWDELRRLQVLGVEVGAVPRHLNEPLLLPAVWQNETPSVVSVEQRFWGESRSAGDEAGYRTYLDILLGSEAQAVERLRPLTAGRDGLLVVNVADLIKLGGVYPERFGIGYRDFPDTGNLHGMIERVKTWLNELGHVHYLVQKTGDTTVRVYYLTDAPSGDALISSLLPFSGGGLVDLKQFKLVYQAGSYWVYRVPGKETPGEPLPTNGSR